MMLHFNQSQEFSHGFSLIELMIVLTIMGVLLTLTGGLVTKNVDKQERLIEVEKVKQVFSQLSYQAYYSGFDIQVELINNTLIIESNNFKKNITFKQLLFVPNHYLVSTKASILPNNFAVQWNDEPRQFTFNQMFEIYE